MACITLFAAPMAMATTQLARVIRYDDTSTGQPEENPARNSLRMNWVVVTDTNGKRALRMEWATA